MPIRNIMISGAALAALTLPATVVASAGGIAAPANPTTTAVQVSAPVSKAAAARKAKSARKAKVRRRTALKRVTRLARTRSRLAGRRHRGKRYLRVVSRWSTPRLSKHGRRLGRSVRRLRRTGGAPNVRIPAALHAIARCESGGNPRAVSASGSYRGLFQFDYGTWRSVGGKGDPAAAHRTEQYRRAAILYARRGAAPWPVCGR